MTDFPAEFTFGAATAAYQIEGASKEDGRTESIWDTFSHTPGKVCDDDTGDVACDHYHRWREDLDLLGEIGVDAYRFSIAWPRIVPSADGEVNRDGIAFYDRLVDGLLERGIRPVATLYHWDLPQWLQDGGGWANRETPARFADYAQVIAAALGDRVGTFGTLNEPWCSAFLGHAAGVHAPGLTDSATALVAAHHLMLAHGLGVSALRSALPARAQISVTLNLATVRGASEGDADAVRHVDGMANRIFLEPILSGRYPEDLINDLRHVSDWSFAHDGDLATIAAPIDVLGVNYYAPSLVTAATPQLAANADGRWVNDPQAAPGPTPWPGTDLAFAVPQDGPYTAMGWRVEPASFTELLLRLHRDYPAMPLMITENGAAYDDAVDADGAVHDTDRIGYLTGHLGAVRDALRGGADVRAYFVWSLLDNFEWAWGFSKRFGLVHVDYDTQQRRLKDSARWYHDLIATHDLPA